jgi:short-subunit dehydrogenase
MSARPGRPDELLAAGRVALVTGASSGIGEAFARALGARGLQVILTGRDETLLKRVAEEIAGEHHVRVETVIVDLALPEGPGLLKAAVDGFGLVPDLLVNNAGAGFIGSFTALPVDEQLASIRLNVEALVALTALYLPAMLARGRGGIVNTGSVAGLQPLPYYAIYGATKAFVASFSQALWAEVRGRGVRVIVVSPGAGPGHALRRAGGRPVAHRASGPRKPPSDAPRGGGGGSAACARTGRPADGARPVQSAAGRAGQTGAASRPAHRDRAAVAAGRHPELESAGRPVAVSWRRRGTRASVTGVPGDLGETFAGALSAHRPSTSGRFPPC